MKLKCRSPDFSPPGGAHDPQEFRDVEVKFQPIRCGEEMCQNKL